MNDPRRSPKKVRNVLTKLCEGWSIQILKTFVSQSNRKAKKGEDPFPDSWVATTAPLAIGTLSDVFCSTIIPNGDEYCDALWPIIINEFQQWATGNPPTEDQSSTDKSKRRPCEVLARIGCNELLRFSSMLLDSISLLKEQETTLWVDKLCNSFGHVLMKHVQDENLIYSVLVDRLHGGGNLKGEFYLQGDDQMITTPFGDGMLTGERIDDDEIVIKIVQLKSGATLYGPMDGMDVKDIKPLQNGMCFGY